MPEGKRPRRAAGEGYIGKVLDPSGNVIAYRAELMVGQDPAGKPLILRKRAKQQSTVIAWLNEQRAKHAKGTAVATSKERLADFLTRWLNTIRPPAVSQKTWEGYQTTARLYIVPNLGNQRLDQLQPYDIQRLYGQLSRRIGPRTIRHVHECLRLSLKQAVRWGILGRNPASAEYVDPPRVPKRPQATTNEQQAVTLVRALRDHPQEAYWLTSLLTGMRPGEQRALKWADIDWNRRAIKIRRAYTRTKKGLELKEPKTGAGRAVPMVPILAAVLKRHQAQQQERRPKGWRDHDLVFPNDRGEPLHESNLYNRSWLPLLEAAGLPKMRPYDLRHSFATLLLSLGTPLPDVQTLMGHARGSTTLDWYADSLPSSQHAAVQRLNDLLSG